MARQKSSKIYIKRDEKIFDFMWANMGSDGSVMIGFPFEGKEDVELILDEELGELKPSAVLTKEAICRPKISFHVSGNFKLTATMGKTQATMDRATIAGPKLADIHEPRRMVEIIIPKALHETNETLTNSDIVLDATSIPIMPLRCTILCMEKGRLAPIVKNKQKIVDTSLWEFIHALENETHEWVWTLRASKNDEIYFDRFIIFLIGPVKWGQN